MDIGQLMCWIIVLIGVLKGVSDARAASSNTDGVPAAYAGHHYQRRKAKEIWN